MSEPKASAREREATVNGPAKRRALDEDDVRVRAGRGSRPRTRRRPAHAEAVDAFVAGVDRGRYRCVIGDRVVTAMKARELGRGNIAVGDTVSLAGDASGQPGSLARVVRIAPRRTVLRRSADDTDPVERIIVANADQLVIVSALADPPPRLRLIDRFLVAAYDASIEPALVLTKADLAGPEAIAPIYAPLGLHVLVLGRPIGEPALADLRGLLAGQLSVLVGHSGVGKSTLVNTLIPDADRAVGAVSPVTGRGRHTSSSVVALALPGGGWIIDTPGLRSFGLGHMSTERVVRAFPDLAQGAAGCPPGCNHLQQDCALDDWVAAAGAPVPPGAPGPAGTAASAGAPGTVASLAARLDSLRRLLRSREPGDSAGEDAGEAPPNRGTDAVLDARAGAGADDSAERS